MPCYEIVVAGGFADKAQARAVSAALKARGVEHYLKPAGAYVGPRPELDAACAALRSPPAGDSRVLFVDTPGVRLPLDPAVAERVLDGGPTLSPLDAERTAWGAALPVRTVDRWTVGDVLVGLTDQGAAVDCPITGFAAGVVGTPHWGWVDQGGGDRPACGSTEVYATVDCGAAIVLPAGSNGLAGRLDPAAQAPRPDLPQSWEDELTGLRALGNETGQLLQEQWTRHTMQWGERQVELWHLRLWTGEGEAVCGGSDYLAEAAGLLDLQGRPLTPLLDTTLAEVLGVVAVDQAPALHLREVITGSQRVVGDGLAIDQGRAYCDCPC